MTDEEYKKEQEDKFNEVVHALFAPTEHGPGGEMEAYHRIEILIRKGYLKPSIILNRIGWMLEQEFSKSLDAWRL